MSGSATAHCLSESKKLDPSITSSSSLSTLKTKLLKLIRPPPKLVCSIYDPIGLAILTQLRVGPCKLNPHKFGILLKKQVTLYVHRMMA